MTLGGAKMITIQKERTNGGSGIRMAGYAVYVFVRGGFDAKHVEFRTLRVMNDDPRGGGGGVFRAFRTRDWKS